ncbi:MAG: hypothetical protein K1000chlam2_01373 [Chlamydiae bacterium]|nr:hypothetical protein [Chlamydiota bacterium]
MTFKKHSLIALAGFIWFSVGLMLLIKGLKLVILAAYFSEEKTGPILNFLMYATTGAILPSVLIIILLGLILGFVKGKWVLGKAAKRTVTRLYPLRGSIRLTKLYRLRDYLLIVGMIGLGRIISWVNLPGDIHAFIDITIGSALINGAMIYFRYAIKFKDEEKKLSNLY